MKINCKTDLILNTKKKKIKLKKTTQKKPESI